MTQLDYGVFVIISNRKKFHKDKTTWFNEKPSVVKIEDKKVHLYKDTLSFDNENRKPILDYSSTGTTNHWQDTTKVFEIKNGYAKSRLNDQAIETEIHLENGIKYFILQGYEINLKEEGNMFSFATQRQLMQFTRRYLNK